MTMSRMPRCRSLLRRSGCLALVGVLACSPEASQTVHTRLADASDSSSSDLDSQDREFLERAAQGGNAEIAIGELAPGRALHPEVAAFGMMLATDHRASNQKLAAIGASLHIVPPASLGESQAGFDRLVGLEQQPFDREFLRVELGDHQQAIQLFQGEAAHGSNAALKAFAAASLPVLQSHLARAEALASIASPTEDITTPPTPDAATPPPGNPFR